MKGINEMLKKNKKLIVIILVIVLTLGMIGSAYASESTPKIKDLDDLDKEYHEHEHDRIADIIGMKDPSKELGVVIPNVPIEQGNLLGQKANCNDCNVFAVTVCAAQAILVEQGTCPHSGAPCVMSIFKSGGAMMCPVCADVLWVYATNHYCWEIHTTCWRGWIDMCPMQVS